MTAVEHASIDEALIAFQAEVPVLVKGDRAEVRSDKGRYSYAYIDLADVTRAIQPIMARHRLGWTCRPTVLEGAGWGLCYALVHPAGRIEGFYPLPASSGSPQQVGSAITYARRYALCSVLGIVADADDDGREAEDAARAEYETRRAEARSRNRQVEQDARQAGAARRAGITPAQAEHAQAAQLALQSARVATEADGFRAIWRGCSDDLRKVVVNPWVTAAEADALAYKPGDSPSLGEVIMRMAGLVEREGGTFTEIVARRTADRSPDAPEPDQEVSP